MWLEALRFPDTHVNADKLCFLEFFWLNILESLQRKVKSAAFCLIFSENLNQKFMYILKNAVLACIGMYFWLNPQISAQLLFPLQLPAVSRVENICWRRSGPTHLMKTEEVQSGSALHHAQQTRVKPTAG